MNRMSMTLAMLAMLSMAACSSSQSKEPLSSGGDAYRDVDNISTLYIMPVSMPDEIHGNASQSEKRHAQEDWPMDAACLIARGVTDETSGSVSATARENKPKADYYFVLTITFLDVGDASKHSSGLLSSDEKGWSHVLATGRIVRADTGDTVAELTFDHSSGLGSKESFQNDMTNLGHELGNWITSRQ